MMYSKDDYVLIAISNFPLRYRISDKKYRGFLLIDNAEDEKVIIANLLAEGAEIYESEEAFEKVYPPLTAEERMKMGKEFLLKGKKKE